MELVFAVAMRLSESYEKLWLRVVSRLFVIPMALPLLWLLESTKPYVRSIAVPAEEEALNSLGWSRVL